MGVGERLVAAAIFRDQRGYFQMSNSFRGKLVLRWCRLQRLGTICAVGERLVAAALFRDFRQCVLVPNEDVFRYPTVSEANLFCLGARCCAVFNAHCLLVMQAPKRKTMKEKTLFCRRHLTRRRTLPACALDLGVLPDFF